MPSPCCSLCGDATSLFVLVEGQTYWRCGTCGLTQLDAAHWLALGDERAVYDEHDNQVDDPGYRRFLGKLVTPLLARLLVSSEGLDYGCGPGPALAAMLREAGHTVSLYDPYYASDTGVLDRTYDFITCTETAEHFQRPGEEFERLDGLLRPGGILAVMTGFQTDDRRFEGWHYRRDPTHVVFYKERSLRLLAARHGWACDVPVKDVVLFRKG